MQVPRIGILVEPRTTWGAEVIRGVGDYVSARERWTLVVPEARAGGGLALPDVWAGEGVVAEVNTLSLLRALQGWGGAVVDVAGEGLGGVSFPRVGVDQEAMAEMVVEHLMDRGLEAYGYVGPEPGRERERRLVEAFEAGLVRRGMVGGCSVFGEGLVVNPGGDRTAVVRGLAGWLEGLARPAGVLVWDADWAALVLEACGLLRYRVPEDVAVVVGAHDDFRMSVTDPALTCVDHGPRAIGYRAAGMLDRLMRGGVVEAWVGLSPGGVVARASTDRLKVEDALVNRAIRFIEAEAHRPIRVGDLVDRFSVSRRSLELRFKKTVGRSPARVIREARLERARRLLEETQKSVKEIALASGFQYQEVMQRAFRQRFDVSPSVYRRRYLLGLAAMRRGGDGSVTRG